MMTKIKINKKFSIESSKYSDKVIEFIATKGPGADFWFFTFLISFTGLLVWLILKAFGIINTPLWIKAFPWIATSVTLLSGIIYIFDYVFKFGKAWGKLVNSFVLFEKRLVDIEGKLHQHDKKILALEK